VKKAPDALMGTFKNKEIEKEKHDWWRRRAGKGRKVKTARVLSFFFCF